MAPNRKKNPFEEPVKYGLSIQMNNKVSLAYILWNFNQF